MPCFIGGEIVIHENKAEFDKTNLTTWLKAGYTGSRNTIVVLDDKAYPLESDNVIEPLPDNTEKPHHKTLVCSAIRVLQPDVKIIAFSWFGSKKKEIIDWIFEHQYEIDAINCSFAGTVQADEFKRLEQLDIPIFCASGNDEIGNTTHKISRPAKYDFTIAVGAWQEYKDSRASYSRYGKELDIVAYTDIYIPKSIGEGIRKFGGTSCASPVAVSLYSAYVDWRKSKGLFKLTRQEAYKFVTTNTVDKLDDGFDIKSGYGLFRLPSEIPNIEEVEEMKFNDVPQGHWAEKAVKYVDEKGYMNGTGDNKFDGDKLLTRYEMAQILYNLDHPEKKVEPVPYNINHIPTNTQNNKRPCHVMKPEFITIHSTANPNSTALNERLWLTNPSNTRTASWHIVVDDKGAIEAIPLNEVAWHAGDGRYGTGNRSSISIEICESGDRGRTLNNAAIITAKLLKRYGLKVDRLMRHYDWSGKNCPRIMSSNNWEGWESFKKLIQRKLEEV